MLRNYFVVAFRSLKRHRLQSLTTILGLALSMAVCLLIITLVYDQKQYDAFHERADRLYRVYVDFKAAINRDKHLYAMSPAALPGVLEAEVPGVERAVRIRARAGGLFSAMEGGAEGVQVEGLYADPAFFDVFSFPLAGGDARTALAEPNTVVLSADAAVRLFGDAEPLGRVVTRGEGDAAVDFTVTGVLAPLPGRTHLPVDAVASLATVTADSSFLAQQGNWASQIYGWYTYFVLEEGASAARVEAALPGLVARHFEPRDENVLHALHLQGIRDINLGPMLDNQLGFVLPGFFAYFLSALAVLIVVVACFNYVGLAVARALKRVREVGVRKVVGARRRQLVAQFLVEAVLYAFCALVAALVLLAWLLPAFNGLWFVQMAGATLSPDLLLDPRLYAVFFGFAALCALAAGLYPAFYLSRFQPVSAVKGEAGLARRPRFSLRKGLVVVQFAVALVLVVSIAVIYRQAVFMAEADYGFDTENVVNVNLQGVSYDVFRNEVAGLPGVENVSGTSTLPAGNSRADVWLQRAGMEEPVKGYQYAVDEHFVDNLGLKLLAGRGFGPGTAADAPTVVLNETALRELGLGTPAEAIGQRVALGDRLDREVIGVVRDFQANLIVLGASPLVLVYRPDWLQWANVRVRPGETAAVVAGLERVWKTFGRSVPIEYALYRVQLSETAPMLLFRDMRHIVGVVALLALVIACLGLLATAAYAAEVRTKEIGIRKVLGASVLRVSLLLSKEFVLLVGAAAVVAAPLAWYVTDLWLRQFANRIGFGGGIVAGCAAGLVAVALLTVASQTVRKARLDPAKSLRYE